MTITHRGSTAVDTTTAALGSTSTTVSYLGVGAGRLAVITAAVKPETATFGTDPTGWTKLGEATGGTGTTGVDVGQSKIGVWYRTLDSTETGSVTINATNGSAVEAVMSVYSTDLGGWETPVMVSGSDATHGTNPSAVLGTWASATAVGDVVLSGYASDTDTTTAASVPNLTQTGTTYGTKTFRSRRNNSSGNDGAVFTWDAPVTAGGSTNAPTAAFTWTVSSCGPMVAVRIRDKVVVPSVINPRVTTGWVASTSGDTEQTVSPTLTIAPSNGDLVIVGILVDKAAGGISAATIVPNQGTWTQVGPMSDTGSPNDHRATWMWRIWNTGDPTALTFTCSAAVEWAVCAMAYYGTSTVTPVGAYAQGLEAGASTASHATATITPASTQPWVGVFFGDRSGSAWTPPSTYTERADSRAGGVPTGISPSMSLHDSARTLTPVPTSLTGTASVSSSTAVWFIFELVPVGETSNPPPQVVLGPWCGNVSSTGATVTYGFSGLTTTARLKVSTTSDLLTSPVYGTATAAGAQGLAKLPVTGLTPNTLYYYGVEADGVLNSEGFGSFRTDPTPGTATSFSVAFGSCQFTQLSGSSTFEAIRQKVGSVAAGSGKARRLIHMGDVHYEDWATPDTLQMIYDQWFLTLNQPLLAPMLAEIPMTYEPDNHDWGGTESNKNNPLATEVATAYRNVVPHYPLPATDGKGMWFSYVIGRVRFIQIDPRSQRDPITDPESSSKTMLGVEQKAWFKSELQQSEPLKIVCGNIAWRTEGGTGGDRWSSFSTEFTELTNFIASTAGVAGKVYVIFGDTHALAADDGSTPGAVGIPQACGAPFQQGSLSMAGITYSHGTYDIAPAVMKAYGWLDIADNGTTITVTYQGITTDDGVVRVTMPITFGGVTPVDAAAGAASGTGAGEQPTAAVQPQAAAAAAGTGSAPDATVQTVGLPPAAAGTGTALAPAAAVDTAAGAPTGSGQAPAAAPAVDTFAPAAAGAGTAPNATVTTETATAAAAETAAGAGAAPDATVQASVSAATATAAGTAPDPAPDAAPLPPAAAGTGAAPAPTVDAQPTAGPGAGAGAAPDATVSTATATTAAAETAAGTGAVPDATASTAADTAAAAGTGTAADTTASAGAAADVAAGAGTAGSPSTALTATAGAAAGTGAAADAFTSTDQGAQADVSVGTGLAPDATIAVAFTAGQADGAGDAPSPTGGAGALTATAAGAGVAGDGSPLAAVAAATAAGAGTAADPAVAVVAAAEAAAGAGAAPQPDADTAFPAFPDVAAGAGVAGQPLVQVFVLAAVAAGAGAAVAAGVTATSSVIPHVDVEAGPARATFAEPGGLRVSTPDPGRTRLVVAE